MPWIVAAYFGMAHHSQAQTQIPATFVLPSTAADTGQPGFIWRLHQVASGQPNENSRTERQLAGLLGDNIADPAAFGVAVAPASPASPSTAPIRFDIAGVMNLSLNGAEYAGNFSPDDVMPGLPGTTGSYDNAAAEILSWLDLPAGTITMGVNSDDGFRMTVGGATPVDKFAPVVGSFNGGRGASDTLFSFTVAQAGLHAVRCTWEQGNGGANIEIFTVNPDGSRVLVNDTANGGIPSYRAVTTPARAYARKVSPAPNSTGAGPKEPIVVELVDGTVPIDASTAALSLDGANVPVTRSKSEGVTTVIYTPSSFYVAGSQHSVVFRYTENGAIVQVPWKFTVVYDIGPSGHLYEVVLAENGITWPDAKAAAESRGRGGVVSHLATITSYEEDLFLERLRQTSKPDRDYGQLWVGGYQKKDPPDFWEPSGGWVWVNNEGPISGYNWGYPYGTYANWLWGEPNNTFADVGGSEDYLAIGLYDNFGWNDDGYYGNGQHDGTLGGYIVEYEPIALLVDIKPGDATNAVNLVGNGKLPVAILSTAVFNASQLDVATIRFGRTGSEALAVKWSMEDVNGDRKKDLLLHFNVQDTELLCDDTAAVLTARTTSRNPASGRDSIKVIDCPHYSLTATALQDINKVTDLELVVRSLKNDAITPAMASQIQLKSLDAVGKLHWTKNFQNVPLVQLESNHSVGNVQVNDVLRHQPLKVKMQVPYSGGTNTEVIYGATMVLLRPDLVVENLRVPPSATGCEVVNIMATIRELNGDVGATTTVYLYDGDQWVDTVSSIPIPPNGTVDVVFSHHFEELGSRTLTVIAGDVTPGDFDLTNNTATGSIEIAEQPFSPVYYDAYYSRDNYEYQYEYQDPYSTTLYHEKGKQESLSTYFSLTPMLEFPLQKLTVQLSADGDPREDYQLNALQADYFDSGTEYYYGAVSRQLADGVYLYVQSYRSGCYSSTSASFYKSAADSIYHSEWYNYYWDTGGTEDGSNEYGQFLNAISSFEIRLVMEHAAGVFGGTTGPIPVSRDPFDYQWDNVWADYGFSRGFQRGESFYGSSSGNLTP